MAYRYKIVLSRPLRLLVIGMLALTACSSQQPEPVNPTRDQDDQMRSGESPETPASSQDQSWVEPDLTVPVTLTEVHRLAAPIAGAVDGTGGLYIAQRDGKIYAVTASVDEPVLDLSALTTTGGERGLLGIAFSVDGTAFYVSYTDVSGDSILASYDVFNQVIVPNSYRQLLKVTQPFANHNGGDVQLGPDGFVYWSLGDGGSRGDPLGAGQDLGSVLGSILRIDPNGADHYAVPADNPFVDMPDARPEIWLYGLRNPWRFSFDRDNGALWIADVGQNSREEINRVAPGESGSNFGWNLMEGTLPFAGEEPANHHRPVFEYDTSRRRCAITGGFVYRGTAIAELFGAYLFSDSCEGEVRAISVNPAGEVVAEARLGINGGNVVAFVEAADGELYVLDLNGAVSRIEPLR